MSEVKWTEEQRQAIHEKNSNILVAAAAGSGKTAVLVERIINKIISEEIDIDKLLVVTFTNAAASEMRERILNAIYKKIEEEPTNLRLQKQITLLNKSNICTIHSFCLDVIRNNFYEINISPNFRIGDTAEIELLKEEVLDELFEDLYLKEDEGFLKLLEIYTSYKDDEPLKELVKTIYNFIQSAPFPEKWLVEKVKLFDIDAEKTDFANTIWGKIILKNYKECIEENILGLKKIKKELDEENELEKFSQAIRLDIENLENLIANLDSWDKSYELARAFSFVRWPSSKKINSETPAIVKEKRDMINSKFKKLKDSIFIYTSAECVSDLKDMYEVLKLLQTIILKFNENYKQAKLERNIIDFNDIEHLALKILVKEKDGNYEPSEIAKKYQDKFEEIAIDEYQDSNMVQEYILTSISKGNNIFMVGDVKQSIYKFRQAMPELFLNKYKTYKLKKEKTTDDDLKIQLFKNFRSRKNILDTTNVIFQEIMSKDLGDVDYNEDEYLNLGASYENPELDNIDFAGKTEINIINLEDTTKEVQEEEENANTERIENSILEAKYVAKKINELINSNYYVLDKKEGYRKITYKDIVVLLRSTTELSPIYEKEISDLGMPVYSETSTEYLNSVEIQLIMSCLKIIDNPLQDIPLVTVMRSMIGGFTDNDLIEIRLVDKYENFYESVVKSRIQVNEELRNKIDTFLNLINNWREESEFLALDELIWKIYMDTGYYNYVGLMQNGKLRQANLKMLFERAKQYESASFKGVFNFINFIDKLKLRNNDLGAAKIIGENENVIRIMSIHKSKGLEFPVVFLSSTGKNFNLKDLKEKILIHQEIGFGPNYENSDLKIEYPTLAKEAIKMVSKKESISEEMRVLYVALTRAKEKLIITGIEKDLQKSLESKEKELEIYETEDNTKINPKILESYKSYLDWIELVYLKNKIKNSEIFELNMITKSEILGGNVADKIKRKDVLSDLATRESSKENIEKIKNILEWEYKYKDSTEMPSELSVSKIKELSKKDSEEKQGITLKKPNFLIEKTQLTPAEKGTIMHLCLQKLNYKEDYNLEKLKNMVNNLVNKEIILPKEAESVNYNKILAFLDSNIWGEMQTAKIVEQEKAFYINIKASEIYKNSAEDEILVQGIIDLYYITADDKLVLVDYKTDYVENNNEQSLKDKYNIQLEIYKKALEEALKRKVDKVYIYSTWLNKEIGI